MDALEYIVTGALTECSNSAAFMPIVVTSNTTVHVQKILAATEMDKVFAVNIPNYGMCAKTGSPCSPQPIAWEDTYEYVKVKGFHPLVGGSCLKCARDPEASITFITSGQVPLEQCFTAETLEGINKVNEKANEETEEYDLERNSVGESGFWEGFIPVWGSGRDCIHSFETGHWVKGIGHGLLVALDVFTLGSDELVIGLVKGGVKGLGEAAGKSLAKKAAAIMAAKLAAKELLQLGAKEIGKLALERLGICIAKACFAAGTIVQTKDGAKNIEDLVSGDEVWAYNEETGETALKHVLNVFERRADSIVTIIADGEKINTTPEHPFYVNGAWKEAGLLQEGDTIQLFNGKAAIIEQVIYKFDEELKQVALSSSDAFEESTYHLTTVYNIEVEDWHTYFVGDLWFLVHNAVCLAKVLEEIKAGVKNLREIMLGRTPGKASLTGRKVIERMESEGRIMRDAKTGEVTHFKSAKDDQWYKIEKADMAHKEDAVTWWNNNKDNYQARSKEVRDFMKDPDNYYLELDKYNRSDGAILGKTNKYELPSK